MSSAETKLKSAVDMALSVLPVEIGCDQCFESLAAYAEALSSGAQVPEYLRPVAEHLERCPACQEELELLRAALTEENSGAG
jgi:hypothetical protein